MRFPAVAALAIASAAALSPLAGQELAEAPAPSTPALTLNPGDVRASNLLGAMVKRLTGETVGEVEDLIVSADGDVRLAVISIGGILGLGARTIAIPFEEFSSVAPDGAIVYLSLSDEELRGRPAFDLESTPAPQVTEPAERAAVPAAHGADHALGAPQSSALASTPGAGSTKATRQPASALIGADIVDGEAVSFGTIRDFILTAEPPDVQAVVELSGASGVSARFVAVPLAELMIARGEGDDPHRQIERVETALTVEQLEILPR